MRATITSSLDHYYASGQFSATRLRAIAWIVLASWVFSLVVCSPDFTDWSIAAPSHHHSESVPASSQAEDHSKSGGSQDDACCTLLKNLTFASQTDKLQMPSHTLIAILLPYIALACLLLFIPVTVRFSSTDPPGKPRHTYIANSLWPNAPPR